MRHDVRTRQLADAHRDDRITRRNFLEGALGLGLSVSGAAALLAACNHSKAASPAAKATKLKGTVRIFAGFASADPSFRPAVQQALAEAFILIHPQVGIDFVGAVTPAAARSQLTGSIAAGLAPDLVLPLPLGEMSRLVDQNTWLDLSPFLALDGVSLDGFLPASTPAARLTGYFGGKSAAVVGLPVGVHDHALAYNEDLFTKARVPVPPASWSDPSWRLDGRFLETARAVTIDGAGKHPGDAGFNPDRISQFGIGRFSPHVAFYDFGGHRYDLSTRRARFAEPGSMAGIQFAADLVNKHHVQPPPAQAEQFSWLSGKLAMIDMCSCEIRSPLAATSFSWRAAALPAGPARRFGFLEVDLGAIPAASANHVLAWEVLKFFAVDPATERRLSYDSLGAMPALKLNRDAFVQGLTSGGGKVDPTPWVAGLPSCSPEPDEWVPAFADVNDLAGAAFDRIVGGASGSQIMAQLQQQAQTKIDAWFKTHKLPH